MSDISFSPEFWNGIAEVMVAMYFSPAAFLPGFYIAYLLLTEKIHPLFRLLSSITIGAGSIIGIWFVLGKNTGLVAGLPGQGRIYLCLLALYISYLLIAGKKLRPFYALLVSS